ncbi:hypothetical protein PYW07_016400 [Mythimna separata]|uniref:MADF domain-containing protein n=1 Tax=Mythimna separata TaxID=271217 RepID=A0AAD7YLK4_MYTSE|nr:hypothetical protein PYW07_016400 [Mythimna separata]
MSWTSDTVLEFLELYRLEQHLWDPKHPLHRNRSEVSDSWIRIQASLSMQFSIADLKKKKESLMTSFRMHLSKKKVQPGYRTTWFAYPLMESFLGGKYECDSTNQLENEYFTNTGNYTTQPGIPEHTTNINRNGNSLDKHTTMGRQSKPASPCQRNSTNKNSSNSNYAKKRVDEVATYLKPPAGLMKCDMDEYELYGRLLAKKLRKLDEHQRDLAMHEIDNVMFRAKMQSTPQQQQRGYSASPSPVPRKLKSPIFIVTQQNPTNIQYEDENITYQEQPPS